MENKKNLEAELDQMGWEMMSSEDSLVLMRPQSLEMGSYGEESEASRIRLHSTHLVAIDNTDAGEWEHHTGLKQQGADSIAYCALECNMGQMGVPHLSDFPVATWMNCLQLLQK